jgi:hypothetical protein
MALPDVQVVSIPLARVTVVTRRGDRKVARSATDRRGRAG